MNDSFIEEVAIVDVIKDEEVSINWQIFMSVKGLEIEAFNCDIEEFLIGKTYSVYFSLLTHLSDLKVIREKQKVIHVQDIYRGICNCDLTGELLNIYDDGWVTQSGEFIKQKHGFVDCGVFVRIELPFYTVITPGEYIYATGRLDVLKIL